MDDLKQIAAQHSTALLAAKPPLQPQLSRSDGAALVKLMEQTRAYYPNQEFDEETNKGFLFDMGRLVTQYGLAMVREALLAIRLQPSQKFFPHPTEIAEGLYAMAEKDRLQKLREHPFVSCGECQGTGFKTFERDGYSYARECACKVTWRAEHKSLGGGTKAAKTDGKMAATGER